MRGMYSIFLQKTHWTTVNVGEKELEVIACVYSEAYLWLCTSRGLYAWCYVLPTGSIFLFLEPHNGFHCSAAGYYSFLCRKQL